MGWQLFSFGVGIAFLWFGTTTTTTTTRLSGIGTGTFVLRWRIVTRGSETWDVSRLAACDYVHSSRWRVRDETLTI
jgi:hypothetical protein